jgi:methylmalonyl-CoA/ethylmalonyl-CoA epimerase
MKPTQALSKDLNLDEEGKMAKIKGVAHVGVAVESVDRAVSFFEDYLGAKLVYKRQIPDQKQISAMVSIGNCNLELMEPTDEDAVIAKYLKSRGQGVHHVSLEVEGLPELVADLEKKGASVIGKDLDGKDKFAFLHPKNAFGILFELSDKQ